MRRLFSLTVGLLAVLAIAHAVYWWIGAGEMRTAVETWIEDWRQKGYEVTHGELGIGGYPLQVHATLPYPAVTDPGKAWSWQAEGVRLQTSLWEPTRYQMTVQGDQAVIAPINGRAVPMDISTADTVVVANFSVTGEFRSGSIQIDELKGSAPDFGATVLAKRIFLELELPESPPKTHTDPAGDVTVIADGVTLPKAYAGPLGQDVDRVSMRFNALGPLERGDLKEVLGAWRDAGGVVEVPWLRGEWGDLTVDAKGTVTLDELYRPLAAFESALGGLSPTLDTLTEAGMIKENTTRIVKLGLALLSSTSSSGKRVIKIPVSIQDGDVYLGPVAVARVRPIFPSDQPEIASDEPPLPALAPLPPPVDEMPLLDEPPVVEWQ